MKRIWLVRHGQSRSQSGEDPDVLNPELSERGREQAQRLARPLRSLSFNTILVSPLKRAWQTYEYAQTAAGHVEFDSRLIESDWGIDRYYESILPVATPGIACADRHDAWLVAVAKRSLSLVKSLLRAPEEKILLFGHWGIFNNLLHTFSGMDTCGVSVLAPMDNTAISLLEIDDQDRRVIRYWNDRAHVIDLI